jgi:type IV pilus assembly protein PilB
MVVCPWCAVGLDLGHCSACMRSLEPDWKVCPWCRTPSSRYAASAAPVAAAG